MSQSGSMASARVSCGGSQGDRFPSTYVEAHGWVKDWSSRASMTQTMITDVNANHLLANLLKYLEKNSPDEYNRVEVFA